MNCMGSSVPSFERGDTEEMPVSMERHFQVQLQAAHLPGEAGPQPAGPPWIQPIDREILIVPETYSTHIHTEGRNMGSPDGR